MEVVQSFWFGPSMNSLISLGAKYAPCMRHDNKVFAEINKERIVENSTGCCMARLSDGCIQVCYRLVVQCMGISYFLKIRIHPGECLVETKAFPPDGWQSCFFCCIYSQNCSFPLEKIELLVNG